MSRKNRIGIDISQLNFGFNGITNYIRGLVDLISGSEADLTVFQNSFKKILPFRTAVFKFPLRNFSLRRNWDNAVLPFLAGLYGIDVMIFPYFNCPSKGKFRKISVIYDLSFLKAGSTTEEGAAYFLQGTRNSFSNADIILTISHYIRKELTAQFGEEKRIEVLYPRIEEGVRTRKKDPFLFLCLGTVEKRKNPQAVIDFFLRVLSAEKRAKLIFAGAVRKDYENVFLKSLNGPAGRGGGAIRYEGAVSEKRKKELLDQAAYTFYLSSYEGFGIPVIEAISYGCIPIVSDIPVMREIGNKACVFTGMNEPGIYELPPLFDDAFRNEFYIKGGDALDSYHDSEKAQAEHFLNLLRGTGNGK